MIIMILTEIASINGDLEEIAYRILLHHMGEHIHTNEHHEALIERQVPDIVQ